MRLLGRGAAAGLAFAAAVAPAAFAEGPGKYSVSGTNVKDKSEYRGTATLTQTGNMTWEVIEEIAGDTLEGFGVGDGKTIAVSFTTDGSTLVVLYAVNPNGGYTGTWAEEGDKDVSIETLAPQPQ
jgi:hypothetical protein